MNVDAGERGTVRTRIVRPVEGSGDLPVLIYIHGAGWVFGDEHTTIAWSASSPSVPASPSSSRCTTGHPRKYPVQIEQNYAVAQWVAKQGREYGLDTSRLAVCGDSVGGNMATVLALMAAERGDVDLRAQVLLYPVTDANFDTASYLQFADGYYLTRDGMKWFWDQYIPDPEQRGDVYASPLRASEERLAALPTTLVITDEADVLRDEGEAYAAKLRAAGVDVTRRPRRGMVHDF
ncbi:alpha/beta hydrolase fold domain-containing protein [Rhodococcus hoagii]|nr:alpha/beta hydrolase fold domain-containing protein [Prescottella equi]